MDMGIQCFRNFEDICHIYFLDMGYFSKYLKGCGILGPPSSRASLMQVKSIAECFKGTIQKYF